MKLLYLTAAAALIVTGYSQEAAAGNASMSARNGSKISIQCKNSGCTVTQYNKAGKRTKILRRPGGRKNYQALRSFYRSKGYK